MANTIGQFDYTTTQMDKGDHLPFDPFVVINLKHWGHDTSGGSPVVSANLMTEREIDAHIANLKADLDAVAVKAKRSLVAARQATMAIVSGRVDDRSTPV